MLSIQGKATHHLIQKRPDGVYAINKKAYGEPKTITEVGGLTFSSTALPCLALPCLAWPCLAWPCLALIAADVCTVLWYHIPLSASADTWLCRP